MQLYSIGQTAKIIQVESHTIRFWVNELNQHIQPIIGKGNRRYFNEHHLSILKNICNLINTQGYTIGIIKKYGIKNSYSNHEIPTNPFNHEILPKIEKIQQEINQIIQHF